MGEREREREKSQLRGRGPYVCGRPGYRKSNDRSAAQVSWITRLVKDEGDGGSGGSSCHRAREGYEVR